MFMLITSFLNPLSKFNELGINIHEPKSLTWWKAGPHLKNAKDYERKWSLFFSNNQIATKGQVLDKGRNMMMQHGLKINY
jgi:hypothetical protein